jgi:hypothetical protein
LQLDQKFLFLTASGRLALDLFISIAAGSVVAEQEAIQPEWPASNPVANSRALRVRLQR